MPAEWELVLDLADDEDPNGRVCCYYFVNCSNRSLFWVHEFNVKSLLLGLDKGNSMRRISESGLPASSLVSISNRRP